MDLYTRMNRECEVAAQLAKEYETPEVLVRRAERTRIIEQRLLQHGIRDECVCGPQATKMTVHQLAHNIAIMMEPDWLPRLE